LNRLSGVVTSTFTNKSRVAFGLFAHALANVKNSRQKNSELKMSTETEKSAAAPVTPTLNQLKRWRYRRILGWTAEWDKAKSPTEANNANSRYVDHSG
jgi:hypothetical protein